MRQLKRVLYTSCLLGVGLGAVLYSSSALFGADASGSATAPNAKGETAPDIAAPADACIAKEITWGYNGGFVAYAPCISSGLGRAEFGPAGISGACTKEIADGAVSAGEISAALEHTDVKAAIAAAPVLYGRDTRTVDGTVFGITLGEVRIELGSDCDGERACKPVPAGLRDLRELLEALTAQQREQPNCDTKP